MAFGAIMKIKAVVFDYGKVICFPPDDSVWEKISSLADITWDAIDPFYKKHRGNYDRGIFSAFGYYKKILDDLKINITDEKIRQMGQLDMNGWKNINPATEKLMNDVKNSGLLLGILSNMPYDFLDFARKNIPVISLPHTGIFSCEAGVIKPEKEIYLKLLSELKCLPEEVVFFDDVPENVSKALELKIEARLWEDCEKARRDLAELGVVLQGKLCC